MDKQKLKNFIQNGVDSLTRIQGEKDHIKQLAEDVKEEFDIKPADFNKRINAAFDLYKAKQKQEEMQDVIDEVEGLGFN